VRDGLLAGGARQARKFLARLGTVGSDLNQALVFEACVAEAADPDVCACERETRVDITGPSAYRAR
jgi:hypothetical protein